MWSRQSPSTTLADTACIANVSRLSPLCAGRFRSKRRDNRLGPTCGDGREPALKTCRHGRQEQTWPSLPVGTARQSRHGTARPIGRPRADYWRRRHCGLLTDDWRLKTTDWCSRPKTVDWDWQLLTEDWKEWATQLLSRIFEIVKIMEIWRFFQHFLFFKILP